MELKRTTWTPNDIHYYDDCAVFIVRDNKQEIVGNCIVDKNMVEELRKYKWSNKEGYARTKINGKDVMMHHLVMPLGDADVIDHINRNPMDNRLLNLRGTSFRENCLNRTKVDERDRIVVKHNKSYFETELSDKESYDEFMEDWVEQ